MIIKEEFADIATPTGPMRLHLFRPAVAGRYPGILLYSEIYQITGPIRRMAAFLAGQGYVVGAPEVYHEYEPFGTVLAYDVPGTDRGNDLKFTKETSAFDSDARAGLDYLAGHARCTGRLGVMGICLGGHLAFRAAMNRDVLAAACFYATDIDTATLGKGRQPQARQRHQRRIADRLGPPGPACPARRPQPDPGPARRGRGQLPVARGQRPARLPA